MIRYSFYMIILATKEEKGLEKAKSGLLMLGRFSSSTGERRW